MSELSFSEQVIDDGSGSEFGAYQGMCACSNLDPEVDEGFQCDTFYVFWDARFNPPHLHVQCYDCEQTYCPYQLCAPPPTVAAFAP